eukprot:evm.model.scf_1020.2 EVM.evm.TU.scf_1020.2   scf_1020:47717-50858(+)
MPPARAPLRTCAGLAEVRSGVGRHHRPLQGRLSYGSKRLVVLQGATSGPLCDGPPADFDLKNVCKKQSQQYIEENFPTLLNLVEDGKLLVYLRPSDYTERRVDGYQEPLEVFVLGTSHFSAQSECNVDRLIKTVEPESVVVELCRSRVALLYADDIQTKALEKKQEPGMCNDNAFNPMSLAGENFFSAILRSTRLGGPTALALRAFLGWISESLSEKFGKRSGAEMRAARKAAEEMDVPIVLGDRPLEITLERALNAMSWKARFELFVALIGGLRATQQQAGYGTDARQELLDGLESLDEDLVSHWLRELSDRFPGLASPLVHERDMYLAWSLKRSKAVNGAKRVVGVMGRAHMRGVMYALQSDPGTLRFSDLVGGKNAKSSQPSKVKQVTKLIGQLAVELMLAYGCYLAWEAVVH